MTRALVLLGAVLALLGGLAARFGLALAQDVARAALTVLGGVIAGIFLWLWHEKATPLALAMTFSWTGATAAMGWWLVAEAGGAGRGAHPALLGFLAVYLTGTLLHLQAIRHAFGLGQLAVVAGSGGALAAAVLALTLLG